MNTANALVPGIRYRREWDESSTTDTSRYHLTRLGQMNLLHPIAEAERLWVANPFSKLTVAKQIDPALKQDAWRSKNQAATSEATSYEQLPQQEDVLLNKQPSGDDDSLPPGERINRAVREYLLRDSVSDEATERLVDTLFPLLFEGRLWERRKAYMWLKRWGTPALILNAGLRAHSLYGYEGWLAETASLLRDLGPGCWPVLMQWIKSGRPECELFVNVVAELPGTSETDRRDALVILAHNPDESTRQRVLESLPALTPGNRLKVLQALGAGTGPDDSVRTQAVERLNENDQVE